MITVAEPRTEFEARVAAARYGDLATYAKAVHELELEPYQTAWEEALESLNRVVIIAPPDTWKSTTVRLFVERAIGRDPNTRILWLMGTNAQATKQVMDVGNIIKEHPTYQAAFGVEVDSSKQWTNQVLFVKRSRFGPDPTLMATGIDGPYQGLHFDIIVIDDPTTPKDVRSPTEMEVQRHMVRGMILDRLAEGGRIIVILTRWGESDLVPTFADMDFTLITMPIIGDYPWGPTLSPKRFPLERMDGLRRDKTDFLFSLTYMCSPESVSGNIIKRDDIRYWTSDSLPEAPLQLFMGVDPAASTRTLADCSAIAVVGLDTKTRHKYLVDCWAKRLEVPDLKEEIIKRATRMAGLRAVGLETSGFQLSLMQDLKRTARLPIVEIPYRSRRQVVHRAVGMDRDKVGRAMYLSSLFSSGRLSIPRDLPLVDGVSYEAELCTFPHGKHDDRLDATVIACTLAEAALPPSVKVRLQGW